MNATDEKPIREKIRAFILASIHVPDLADDDNLFESGIVNSLFAVQLMTFIEKTFGIEVGMDDLEIANFKSIEASADFVIRKKAQPETV
ncbi:MAG: phosphopantetheine-binding protein [Chthoniobacterales bacterium]